MKPKKNTSLSLYFILILLVLTGCGSPQTEIKKFYLIEPPSIEAKDSSKSEPAVNAWCEVAEVEVYPAYSTRQIVFRDASHQIRYFGHHEWVERPAEILKPLIIDYLSAQNTFARVAGSFWDKAPDYLLKTTLFALEVRDSDNEKLEARLYIRFQLFDMRTGTVVIMHTADKRSIVEDNSMNLAASATSTIFYDELEVFAVEIRKELAAN
ncbi:MAG: ABC-type transport auxiliary lipoprotein family protein [Desulforhopalus sp.]